MKIIGVLGVCVFIAGGTYLIMWMLLDIYLGGM